LFDQKFASDDVKVFLSFNALTGDYPGAWVLADAPAHRAGTVLDAVV
jgi:hypothetical protein